MEYDLIRLWLGMISDIGNAALGRILDYFGRTVECSRTCASGNVDRKTE